MGIPIVSIVGRPNVGKSTLFNRITGKRKIIVSPTPGTTRDLCEEKVKHKGYTFILRDTGGFFPSDEDISRKIFEKLMEAISSSHLILFVVDGKEGLTSLDRDLFYMVKKLNLPYIVVFNKVDCSDVMSNIGEVYELSLEPIPISAEHGNGVDELLDLIVSKIPKYEGEDEEPAIKVTIAGRPNVGKSMLLNRILGYERVIVSEVPGTTRDPIDTLIKRDGKSYLLIDTAGIRRKSRTKEFVEKIGIIKAVESIRRSDIVLLVIDASEGITDQDKKVAGIVEEEGKGIVLVFNKWDLVDGSLARVYDGIIKREFSFLGDVPYVTVSAKTGKRINKIFEVVDEVYGRYVKRVSTSKINSFLKKLLSEIPPQVFDKKPFKMYYATQVSTAPPTFVIFANTRNISENFRRFLVKRIKKQFNLHGVPVRLLFRSSREG